MRSIIRKNESYRKAVAQASIQASEETFKRMLANDLPKRDVLPIARAAGVMSAKKTWEIIPYCHPINTDAVAVEYRFEDAKLMVEASVECIAKTGVEMEALTACSMAALTIYDMLKPIDKNIHIENIHLLSKEGGKTDFKECIPIDLKAVVIVTSDGTYEGTRKDKSGQIIKNRLEAMGISSAYEVLPDEQERIAQSLSAYIQKGFTLIMTTGGTGLGPRDVTVEATQSVVDREVPGIMEAARSFGQRRTPYAMLSRGIVGQKGRTLIANLPGSSKGVEESLDAIFPHLLHAYKMMGGGGHPATKANPVQKEVRTVL